MKDLYTMMQGERFSYETIDIDYLRTRQQLPDWLREHKRSRAEVHYGNYLSYSDSTTPPGHPRTLAYQPHNWTGKVEGCVVIPDPDNLAYVSPEYTREKKYEIDVWDRENKQPTAHLNRYYVVYQHDYKKLWKSLPWDHLRMRVWEVDMYYHFSQYLGHDDKPFSSKITKSDLISKHIWEPEIDPHWTEEYKVEVWAQYHLARSAAISQHEQYAKRWATPERHQAVIEIRKRYKDYQPRLDLIEDYKSNLAWQWIEPYRWYYRYASLEDQENDPIFEIEHKKR